MSSMWDGLYRRGSKPTILELDGKPKPKPRPCRVAQDWRPLVGHVAAGNVTELDQETQEIVRTVLRDEYGRRKRLG